MNNKTIVISILLLVLVGVGFFFLPKSVVAPTQVVSRASSPQDATYIINDKPVTLVHGVADVAVDSTSATKIHTQYFGNEVTHDFDGDGRQDTAFIITQNTGGSGTFYYVVTALNTVDGYVGSHALLLGDRIAPQTTQMGSGNTVIVNYADRNPGESFATPPSVGKSIWLLLDPTTLQFGEVAQHFEGEADPSKMTLTMQTWGWVHTIYNNDTTVTPKVTKKFVLTLKADKTFSASTDCNGVGGEYKVVGNTITFTKMMSTMMYCEGSQEQQFGKMLQEVTTFSFTSKGELILGLKNDSGSMVFK